MENNTEKLVNSEGEEIKIYSFRDKYIVELANKIYNNDELLQKALIYCQKEGNDLVSMEEYVEKHFSKLITKFPDLRDVYVAEVRFNNKQNKKKKFKRIKRRK